jgi:hypothetical protein
MNRSTNVAMSPLRIAAGLIPFCPGALTAFGCFGGKPGAISADQVIAGAREARRKAAGGESTGRA